MAVHECIDVFWMFQRHLCQPLLTILITEIFPGSLHLFSVSTMLCVNWSCLIIRCYTAQKGQQYWVPEDCCGSSWMYWLFSMRAWCILSVNGNERHNLEQIQCRTMYVSEVNSFVGVLYFIHSYGICNHLIMRDHFLQSFTMRFG
jgi:hypothetical protein